VADAVIPFSTKILVLGSRGMIDAHQDETMKSAAVAILLCIALCSEAFAILRPRYPAKPAPPFRGHVIIIEDSTIKKTAGKISK